MAMISRTDVSGMIPEPITREIFEGVVAESAVLSMGRRLPDMTSGTQAINVLDVLPTAYWVDADGGVKQTTKAAWAKKRLYAEELAVIVPIPEAVLDDAEYDIWASVRPRIVEAFHKAIDAAILFGTNKPTSWRDGIFDSCVDTSNFVIATSDLYQDIMGTAGVIAKVEEDGYLPNGVIGKIGLRASLRGLVDQNGVPIFVSNMQGSTNYMLDGMPLFFPTNGGFDSSNCQMIVGDFSQLVYAVRQDITYKLLDQATIIDPADNTVVYSLAQQDMVALRCVMRLGWEVPNPVNEINTSADPSLTRFPFAILCDTDPS